MRRTRAAFTLVDLLVTIAVMAVVVLAAIPAFTPDNRTRIVAAANLLIADLNNARAMSIQNPSDPVRVVIGEGGASYFLAKASDPTNPIELPTGAGGKYAVIFGEGDHIDLWEIRLAPAGTDHDAIAADDMPFVAFDAFGRLNPDDSDARIEVCAGTPLMTVVIRADTGDAYIE